MKNFIKIFLATVLIAICMAPSAKADVITGIVGWWKFDSNASDFVGFYTGTLNNGPTYATGKIGQAIDLNGTNQYVSGNGPNLANSPFSISAWIWADQFSNESFYSMGSSAGTRKAIHLRIQSATPMRFGLYGDDLDATLVNISGRWTHIAVTFDSSNV
jgi:hypothetical protein